MDRVGGGWKRRSLWRKLPKLSIASHRKFGPKFLQGARKRNKILLVTKSTLRHRYKKEVAKYLYWCEKSVGYIITMWMSKLLPIVVVGQNCAFFIYQTKTKNFCVKDTRTITTKLHWQMWSNRNVEQNWFLRNLITALLKLAYLHLQSSCSQSTEKRFHVVRVIKSMMVTQWPVLRALPPPLRRQTTRNRHC